jgi:hypothetical protein
MIDPDSAKVFAALIDAVTMALPGPQTAATIATIERAKAALAAGTTPPQPDPVQGDPGGAV